MRFKINFRLALLLFVATLAGCGGGGGSGADRITGMAVLQSATATDGLNRFNEWRAYLGLPRLERDARLDYAAQTHSDVQASNDVITHGGLPGHAPGWETLAGRITGAGFSLAGRHVIGEVISRTASTSGSAAADALIAAIYHRFVIFEPMFSYAGVGAATSGTARTYFTTNFAGLGLASGIGRGNAVVYPRDGQTNVQRNFFSDQEVPDPVCTKNAHGQCTDPGLNEVGYPISIHADIAYLPPGASQARVQVLSVASFTVTERGASAPLPVERLWSAVDPATTARAAAAIVPLAVLRASTVYDVAFSGTLYEEEPSSGNLVNPVAVSRSWSFTTAP